MFGYEVKIPIEYFLLLGIQVLGRNTGQRTISFNCQVMSENVVALHVKEFFWKFVNFLQKYKSIL